MRSLGELGTILRRAFLDAAKPPTGPVFASLAWTSWSGRADAPRWRRPVDGRAPTRSPAASRSWPTCSPAPGRSGGDRRGRRGGRRRRPGDGRRVAEALGAPVHGSPLHSREVFDPTHPLWAGMLPPSAAAIRSALDAYERVLLIGGQAFMVYPTPGPPLEPATELLHLSPDPAPLAGPIRSASASSVTRPAAHGAAARVWPAARPPPPTPWRRRRPGGRSRSEQLDATARAVRPGPMDPMAAAPTPWSPPPGGHRGRRRGHHHRRVRAGLPPPPTRPLLLLPGRRPRVGHAGGARRVAGPRPLAGALRRGRRLGHVLAQALWTAAREGLPVVFAVVDNGQYRSSRLPAQAMGDSARTGTFVAMDLEPPVDFVGLARRWASQATLVGRTDDIGDAVQCRRRPHLSTSPGEPDVMLMATNAASPIPDPRDPEKKDERRRARPAAASGGWSATGDDPRRHHVGGPSTGSGGWCSGPTAREDDAGPDRVAVGAPVDRGGRGVGRDLGRVDVRRHRTGSRLSVAALADLLRPEISALDIVMTARYGALEPWWHRYDDADRRRARCSSNGSVGHLADRTFGTLSSGERKRCCWPARWRWTRPRAPRRAVAGLDLGAVRS